MILPDPGQKQIVFRRPLNGKAKPSQDRGAAVVGRHVVGHDPVEANLIKDVVYAGAAASVI